MSVHDLKCWPEFFQAVWDGHKTAELRIEDDRRFAVGDTLRQHEYEPMGQTFSGRMVASEVTHIVRGFVGLAPGYVMLSLSEPRQYHGRGFDDGEVTP